MDGILPVVQLIIQLFAIPASPGAFDQEPALCEGPAGYERPTRPGESALAYVVACEREAGKNDEQ